MVNGRTLLALQSADIYRLDVRLEGTARGVRGLSMTSKTLGEVRTYGGDYHTSWGGVVPESRLNEACVELVERLSDRTIKRHGQNKHRARVKRLLEGE